MNQTNQHVVWVNNSRTARPTLILLLILSSLDNLLSDTYIIFQKDVDNFDITKHVNFWVGGAVGVRCLGHIRSGKVDDMIVAWKVE